ncbi:MAG TPA: hypothetical protein VK821_05865 [Dehalococcoidia bacterium]|nr:hypothetical protein [Dehalococcoidia bacterium]
METSPLHCDPTELPPAAELRGLSAEIDLVRTRLRARIYARRASDRFIREQATLIARLHVADVRARAIDPDDSASRISAAINGPLAPLIQSILGPQQPEPGEE